MKLFIDSANIEEIYSAVDRGIQGVTTNPSLIAKEESDDVDAYLRRLAFGLPSGIPLSVEATGNADEIIHDAYEIWMSLNKRPGLTIKIPIGWEELDVVTTLAGDGVPVNVTACMSYSQAIMAANAGATYVSLFWGRISDTGTDAASVVRQVRETFDRDGCKAEIIVGSIRAVRDVTEALQAGAHIVTAPPTILKQMCKHPKTDEVVAQFERDARREL
jgi:transaldolase